MKPKVSIVKSSAAKNQFKASAAPGPVVNFVFVDNEDTTCSVNGVDSAGNLVDIAPVASLSVTSSDPSVVSVDSPDSMRFAMHAVGPLTTPGTPVNITAVATWNDGSLGPFTFTLPVDVIAGPAASIVIKPGTPTVH